MAAQTECIKAEKQEAALPGAALSDRATYLSLALILLLVFLAYLDTLWFDFVHDDGPQIVGNTWLRSWKYLPRYFTADVWAFQHPVFRGTFYRPVFLLWFRLQYVVFGLHPWGWHLCTVLCHVAVTVLVFFTAERLLRDRLAALFAALIFGLHPSHAEAVAWISGVTEPLFAVFLLASYLCYLESRQHADRKRFYQILSLVLYALASLSKETAVILPVLIFATEMIFDMPSIRLGWQRWTSGAVSAGRAAVPYVVLFVVYMVARLLALKGFQNTKENHTYLAMFLTWPSVLWFYIQHLVWPTHLNPFYFRDFYTHVDMRNVVLPGLIVGGVGAGLIAGSARSPRIALAFAWMLVPLLPALDLRAFIEGHLVHDRYLYLPSFGFALLVALGIRHLNVGGRLLGQPALQLGIAGVLALAMGTEIVQATACFASDATFFPYVAAMSKHGNPSEWDLAALLGSQGHVEEAIKLYKEILPTQPDSWDVNYNLGYAYYLTGNLPDAEHYLTRATQLDASRPDAFLYLGLAKLKLRDVDGAAADVQRAVTIRPDAIHYHFALGIILRLQGNLPAALSEFEQEIDLDPTDASARQQVAAIRALQAAAPKP